MSIKNITAAICLLALAAVLSAQPRRAWIRYYGGEGLDGFCDVYATADGGYIMCGRSDEEGQPNRWTHPNIWIVRVDNQGEVIWEHRYELFEGDVWSTGSSVIETDDGDFVVGGCTDVNERQRRFIAVKISGDGDLIWENQYGGDFSGWCAAVIETKAGQYLLGGRLIPENGGGRSDCYVVMIEEDGDVIWERTYGEADELDRVSAIREAPNDGFLLGSVLDRTLALIKIDDEGEVIWQETYARGSSSYCQSLVSTPNGYALGGKDAYFDERGNFRSQFRLVLVNRIGQLQLDRVYPRDLNDQAMCLARMWDGGFTLVGYFTHDDGGVIRTEPGGDISWTADNFPGPLRGVVVDWDGNSLICGFSGFYRQGILVKYFPERSAPVITDFHPPQLELEILSGDTIQFWVHAEDIQEDSLSYLWTLDADTVSTDTAFTHIFEELGDFLVKCVVSDSTGADSVQWEVHVCEFYIDGFTPDSLEMTVRRGSNVDFTLDIAAIEDIELHYLWTLTDRNRRRQEVGEADSVSVCFDLTGDYWLESLVWRGEESDEVNWNIHVRSAVWYWWPREDSLTVSVDSTILFAITPFNPDSDSLEYLWTLDGDTMDFEQEIEILFEEISLHEVVAYVNDGCETDTIRWEVTVVPLASVPESDIGLLPTEPVLYPPAPNPFNAKTVARFYTPDERFIDASIYDLTGRVVSKVHYGSVLPGEYNIYVDARDLPAGVYVLVMRSDGVVTGKRKIAIIR